MSTPAASAPSISTTLAPFAKNNYTTLFSSDGGFPVTEKGKWKVTKVQPKDLSSYYSSLANYLVSSGDYDKIPKLEHFIIQFNSCRSSIDFPGTPKLTAKTHYIFFNSKNIKFQYLSNFYESLVLFRDHHNSKNLFLYPSSENAYQAHKIAYLYQLSSKHSDKKERKKSESDPRNPLIDSIAKETSSQSKLLAKKISLDIPMKKPDPDSLARTKYKLLSEIVQVKFQYNTTIALHLKATEPCFLIENSSDLFWGSKKADDPALKKHLSGPISAKSRNCAGRILTETRSSL
jgi:predicted NAD-dependent protein-ADP-ribosyltransferase YbiA (DUF1768 family)